MSLPADIPPPTRTSPPGAPARPPIPAPLHIITPSNGPSDTVRVMLNDAERPPSAGTAYGMDERAAHERECGVVRLEHAGSAEDQRPAFEVLVVGCGGGPLETNLSSYLLKPYDLPWSAGCTLLEGGSTMGALSQLIEAQPHAFTGFGLNIGVDLEEVKEEEAKARKGSRDPPRRIGVGREGGGRAAGKVWEMIKCFSITHAHLDHIQGLIISSGASLQPRPLYGTRRTIENIERIFDGGVWPMLAGWESDGVKVGRAYLYRDLPAPSPAPLALSPHMSLIAYPLSHGMDPSFFHRKHRPTEPPAPNPPLREGVPSEKPKAECYDSTAFFVKESATGQGREMLFFGDVEPDSISKRPLNRAVWEVAAPKIVQKKLNVIFLECSYPTSQPPAQLWGHLSPPYLFEELVVLAKLVEEVRISAGWSPIDATKLPLQGVTIVIIHIKDDTLSLPPASPTSSHPPSRRSTPPISPARPDMPRRVSPRSRLAAHTSQQLTMSPPQPSVPLRRASGSGASGGANVYVRRKSLDVREMGWDSGRRSSVPWNIQLGATAGGASGPTAGPLAPQAASTGSSPTRRSGPPLSTSPQPFAPEVPSKDGLSPRSLGRDPSIGPSDRMSLLSLDSESIAEEGETEEETVHERIERELNELEEVKRTGVRFLRAEQGMRIVF